MGRPRKPTAVLELVGAFKHNPNRTREGEPECTEEVGPAPARLSDLQAEAWDYIVDCCADGVLTKMDRPHLELTVISLASVWAYNAYLQGQAEKGEAVTIGNTGSLLKDTAAMLGRLGMNPSERSKVVVAKKDTPNPFANFRKA